MLTHEQTIENLSKIKKKSDLSDKFYKLRTIWVRITDISTSPTGFTADFAQAH